MEIDREVSDQRTLSELVSMAFGPESAKSMRRNWADWERLQAERNHNIDEDVLGVNAGRCIGERRGTHDPPMWRAHTKLSPPIGWKKSCAVKDNATRLPLQVQNPFGAVARLVFDGLTGRVRG